MALRGPPQAPKFLRTHLDMAPQARIFGPDCNALGFVVENRQHAGIFDIPALKHNGQVPCGLIGTITVEFGHLKSFVFGTRCYELLTKK